MDEDQWIELSDAIGVVREQLVAAQTVGRQTVAGQSLTFAVGKVSIEFAGEVKRVAGGSGGVKFWVVTADAKSERTSSAAHKVTVELVPQTPQGAPFIVADDADAPPPN
ncbi:trypco2 family protein [Amycolatopsis sp. NPDC024027]|uniref:trypco2 family protein n=1 Tax=Amycolatopsis sp. NPDC024027 TaxID=3154327 RepID=UPI0033C16DD2